MSQQNHLEAFEDEDPADSDFAGEHDDTTVEPEVAENRGSGEGEPESPRGWDGMDQDGPP